MRKRMLSMLLSLVLAAGILFAAAPSARMVWMPGAYSQLLQEIRIGVEEKGFHDALKYRPDDVTRSGFSAAAQEYFRCKWSDCGQGGNNLTQTIWALRDLDGNGVPELLLSAEKNNLDVLYTVVNGKAVAVESFEYRGMGAVYGNYIRAHGSGGAAYYSSHYYVLKGAELVRVDGWNSEYGRYKTISGASITEAQANALDAKYQAGAQPDWHRLCNGERFVDVLPGDWYADSVTWAVEKGITVGTDRMTFSPESTCTRAQIVTFLHRAAGEPAPSGKAASFRDVPAGAYYHDAVLWAVEKGITKGTAKNLFSPNAGCTRGQVVTFLYRAAGSPAVKGTNPFKDVSQGAYYYNAVLWAVNNGITSGMSATAFAPDGTCTRAQIAAFLYRCR